jgi:hypothetical protein
MAYTLICPGEMMHLNTASTDRTGVVPTPTPSYGFSMPDGSVSTVPTLQQALLLLFLKEKGGT